MDHKQPEMDRAACDPPVLTPANIGLQADVGVSGEAADIHPDFVSFVALGVMRRRRNRVERRVVAPS